MENETQRALRAQTLLSWGVLGLLALNLTVLLATRTSADGNAAQTVKIDGAVEVKLVHDPNAKPLRVEIEAMPKVVNVKESK